MTAGGPLRAVQVGSGTGSSGSFRKTGSQPSIQGGPSALSFSLSLPLRDALPLQRLPAKRSIPRGPARDSTLCRVLARKRVLSPARDMTSLAPLCGETSPWWSTITKLVPRPTAGRTRRTRITSIPEDLYSRNAPKRCPPESKGEHDAVAMPA